MLKVDLDLGPRSYPIFIGKNILGDPGLFLPHLAGHQVMIVSNETIAPLYLETLQSNFPDQQVDTCILPDGESFKTWNSVNLIIDQLLEKNHNRRTTLIALGGGVVGDITGFAAASYQRGVAFIQAPTTLLAQVDSSVGGKTGVNHPLGKNMIGAFHQPRAVIADTLTLNTLVDRQFAAGLAEVIKYGLIRDAEFYRWIKANLQVLLARNQDSLAHAILRSCELKAEIVAADEFESDQRALLNLGHTFGHAIETHTGYGAWLHGEAIATGMCLAADLSRRLNWLSEPDQQDIVQLIQDCGLPDSPPADMSIENFLTLMAHDKKVISGKLRLVLQKGMGHAITTEEFDLALLRETLGAVLEST